MDYGTGEMGGENVLDYAIVGSGIAGLYAAHRLLEAGKGSVHVYEKETRPGGRLLSVGMPGIPYLAELGASRFLDRHLLVYRLARQLELRDRAYGLEGTRQMMYLRGCHIREGEDCNYRLDRAERNMGRYELIIHAFRSALREVKLEIEPGETPHANVDALGAELKHLKARLLNLSKANEVSWAEDRVRAPGEQMNFGIDYFTARQWEILKRFGRLRGVRLYDTGFGNLLQQYLSSEAFLFLKDALGFESILLSWNAAEAMQWFLRDFSGRYIKLVDGMQMLAAAICYKHRLASGEELVSTGHTLTWVTPRKVGEAVLWELHFDIDETANTNTLPPVPILAKNVILALPPDALKDVAFPLGDPNNGELLNTVRAHHLFKLFLGYDRVWWNDPRGIEGTSGSTITDLPIRQVHYFGPEHSINPEGPTAYGMLMASYSDSHHVDFWEPMLSRRGTEFYCTLPDLTPTEAQFLRAYGVSPDMVRKAHRQIRMLHPELSMADLIPEPVVALVKDWPNGWHAWRVHARPWLVMKFCKRPMPKDTLFICGEAFSEDQGWVEGALRSTERVLQQIGLEPPHISEKAYRSIGYEGYSTYIGNWPDLD
jgi:hypothetical protein